MTEAQEYSQALAFTLAYAVVVGGALAVLVGMAVKNWWKSRRKL